MDQTILPLRQHMLQDYVAASIFWWYIIAALYLIVKVVSNITTAPITTKDHPSRISQRSWLFAALAGGSFAVLSFNMLNILIRSFLSWSCGHEVNLLSIDIISDIWQWSLETKPFRSFVLDIFADVSSTRTSVAALTVNMLLSMYMALEGRRHDIRDLWAYFALAQILPISLSSSLFFTAVVRSESGPATQRPTPITLARVAMLFVLILTLAIHTVRDTQDSVWLLPLVVAARSVLLIPLMISEAGTSKEAASDTPGVLLFLIQFVAVLSLAFGFNDLTRLFRHGAFQYVLRHPAASTLSCDLMLTSIVCEIWSRTAGPYAETRRQAER